MAILKSLKISHIVELVRNADSHPADLGSILIVEIPFQLF